MDSKQYLDEIRKVLCIYRSKNFILKCGVCDFFDVCVKRQEEISDIAQQFYGGHIDGMAD